MQIKKEKILLYVIFHLFSISLCSQPTTPAIKVKKSADSIFYGLYAESFSSCYKVVEVAGVKSQEKHYKKEDFLIMRTVSANDSSMFRNLNRYNLIALGDTVINWQWEPNNPNFERNGHRIDFGKASLNQKTNTLTITEIFYNPKKKLFKKLKVQYKVLKWTYYEIIFKDITHKETSRVFAFRRYIQTKI